MLQFRYVRFVSRWLFAMWLGTFSLSQMNNVELARTFVMARKRTFRGTKKNVFVKPNEQCRACSNICHGEKTHFSRNEKNMFGAWLTHLAMW